MFCCCAACTSASGSAPRSGLIRFVVRKPLVLRHASKAGGSDVSAQHRTESDWGLTVLLHGDEIDISMYCTVCLAYVVAGVYLHKGWLSAELRGNSFD
jgi:hypothetical protein